MTTIARALPLLILLGALPAAAAPIDDAKKAFSEGKAAFERGDYEVALVAYQRANMILPAPNLYYNIGATYERLGRFQEAALAFDKYFELVGAPTSDEEREFQDKLRVRAEANRKRLNQPTQPTRPAQPVTTPPPPQTRQQQPVQQPQQSGAQQPPMQQPPPPYYRSPYYAPAPYYVPPSQTREGRLKEARGRRTRAIVLMAVGAPLTVAGVGLFGWALGGNTDLGPQIGYGFLGASLGVIGITLWAPGLASFLHASRDIRDLDHAEPMPPSARGF